MKQKKMTTFLILFCFLAVGLLVPVNQVQAKKITSMEQAKKLAQKKVKNSTVTELDKDYEKGVLVYEVQLVKGTKEYNITYRASDGKMLSYGWEEHKLNKNSQNKVMSKSQIKKLAKQKVKNAKITRIEKKYDDGVVVYKLKMKTASRKYELEYHGRTGKLLEFEWEIVTKSQKGQDEYIGVDQARNIALGQVPGASVIKIEFDQDDGTPVYEVELIKDGYEYEIKIHAKTGEILEFEKEAV